MHELQDHICSDNILEVVKEKASCYHLWDIESMRMVGIAGEQSNRTQIPMVRTYSSRRTGAVVNEEPKQSDTLLSAANSLRIWPFHRTSREAKHDVKIDNLTRDNWRLRQQLCQEQEQRERLQVAQSEVSKRIEDYERKYAEAKRASTEHFEKHTRECQQEIRALKQQVYDLEMAKAASQAIANSTKVSDTVILEIWKRMAYNIYALVNTLLVHCPEEKELVGGYQPNGAPVPQTTPAEYKLLADENTRSAVAEHYIWRSIFWTIFGGGREQDQGGAWGGHAGDRLHFLCLDLLPKISDATTVSEFFQWKSQGAAMIEKLMGVQHRNVRQLVMLEHHRLWILLPPDKREDESASHSLYNDLLTIFRDALQLHSIFLNSKAHFFFHWITPTESVNKKVAYSPDFMEAEMWGAAPDDSSVVFNISPGLYKVGTADGVDYHRNIILVKARVVCD